MKSKLNQHRTVVPYQLGKNVCLRSVGEGVGKGDPPPLGRGGDSSSFSGSLGYKSELDV